MKKILWMISLKERENVIWMDDVRVKRFLESVDVWTGFYRWNPHRLAKDYLKLNLKIFQQMLLCLMNVSNFFCWIAARGLGKTFLIAVYCCIRCILYPGTKICIASGTRGQSVNVLEKIKLEILPNSPLLQSEIKRLQISASDACIDFYNTSSIKVVTASDSARGNRANILICDEFRMISLDVIGTVLRKFLTAPRMPGYLHKKQYAHLRERNKELYLSSAFYKSHWSYDKFEDYAKNMLDDSKSYFTCGFPYQLSIKEGLLDEEAVRDEMTESNFNEIRWSMEMCAEFWGDADGTFFNFESISGNRKIQYPMLPDELSIKLNDSRKVKILPKQPGEKRILSVDLALMASKKNKNDASAIFINQLIPTKNGRYISNFVYTESSEGEHTFDQALRVRKLYDMYYCDYIVIDARGVGLGVVDALVREIADPETGEIYPALSCCNNSEWAARCTTPGAEKALWVINASDKFNSECAILLREGFKSGKIRLLQSEYDGEVLLSTIKGYNSLNVTNKTLLQLPYINTTLLINELINLQHEESGGMVKIVRKGSMRKDRFSSISYNYYVACQLEAQLKRKNTRAIGDKDNIFMYRAPKIR